MPEILLHRDCPGYAEAEQREEELRAIPFLGIPETICGVKVAPLTLRRLQWLTMIKSPFLMRLEPEVLATKPDIGSDIERFLWCVSPKFNAGDEKARKRFGKQKLKNHANVIKEICEYMDEAFLDRGESDMSSRSFYSAAAALVCFFHHNYGLSIDVWDNSWLRNLGRKFSGKPNILDIPLRIAFQLVKAHGKSVNPDATFLNRLSQPKIDDFMASLNKRN